jgi:ubiquitin-protein ligase
MQYVLTIAPYPSFPTTQHSNHTSLTSNPISRICHINSTQGGHFTLHLSLPNTYPFKPPILNFATKIYHPNISNDEKGSMCLGMLRSDEWKPPNRILAVLNMARTLLIEPSPDDAIETGIAEQYKNKRAEWEKEAKSWTKRYAGGK